VDVTDRGNSFCGHSFIAIVDSLTIGGITVKSLSRRNIISVSLLILFALLLGILRCIGGPFDRRVAIAGPRAVLVAMVQCSLAALSFPLGWLGQLTPGTNGVAGVIWFAVLSVVNVYLLGFVVELALRALARLCDRVKRAR
jgi:hypothetical protein